MHRVAGRRWQTTLALTEAIALATGRPLLGVEVPEKVNVWHYNLEDPLDELHIGAPGRSASGSRLSPRSSRGVYSWTAAATAS